jgi:hypothetical protein
MNALVIVLYLKRHSPCRGSSAAMGSPQRSTRHFPMMNGTRSSGADILREAAGRIGI